MLKNTSDNGLDETDRALLRILQREGCLPNVELARRIHLSPPATHARVRYLEEQGYIRKYTAIVDRERAGPDRLWQCRTGFYTYFARTRSRSCCTARSLLANRRRLRSPQGERLRSGWP